MKNVQFHYKLGITVNLIVTVKNDKIIRAPTDSLWYNQLNCLVSSVR